MSAVADGDGGQAAAVIESISADGCHAVGDGDGGQAAAIRESILADGCHAVGDGDGGQAAAIRESILADGCHAVRDSCVFTSHYQFIRSSLNNRITAVGRVIDCITCIYGNSC